MSVAGYTRQVRQTPAAPIAPTAGCGGASGAGVSEAGPSTPPNDEQFRLVDEHSGRPLAGVRYEIRSPSGVFSGRTDPYGFTQRVNTGGKREPLEIYVLPEQVSLEGSNGSWSGCTA